MKIEYGRNLQSSFMRILLEGEIPKIEEAMLSRNNIEGLIEITWQKEDMGYVLRCDITGKQALDVMLENEMADENLLVNLIQEICFLCRRLEKFLLSADGLVLETEMIYFDARKKKFNFCYCPGEAGDFRDKFLRLMEYLLTKTDHKNKRAVEIVYGVYETLIQESNNVNEIQQTLEKIRKSWKSEEEINDRDNVIAITEEEDVKVTSKVVDKRNIIKNMLKPLKNSVTKWIKLKLCNQFKQRRKNTEFIFEPEEEQEKITNPTILLSAGKMEMQGILKYEGSTLLKDITISKTPFLIGSGTGCDAVIEDATISRKHAMITKIDDVYFIEDLNSSNGTRVEGEFVSYKTKISLKKNDVIWFSEQRYRFL